MLILEHSADGNKLHKVKDLREFFVDMNEVEFQNKMNSLKLIENYSYIFLKGPVYKDGNYRNLQFIVNETPMKLVPKEMVVEWELKDG